MVLSIFLLLVSSILVNGNPLKFVSQMEMKPPVNAPTPPKWGSFYTASGSIQLPYAELNEPFHAWYDEKAKKSRIEYYNGMTRRFERADKGQYGTAWTVNPMTNNSYFVNQVTCFQVNGSKDDPVEIQTALPDTSNLAYVGLELQDGRVCQVWRNVTVNGNKKNTYTLWVSEPLQLPVKYEMMGYNTLFGSHYDKYIVQYYEFNNYSPIDASSFELPAAIKSCQPFPGPGDAHSFAMHHLSGNPFAEMFSSNKQNSAITFDKFKTQHGKSYESEAHHEHRRDVFSSNLRYIHAHNRKGDTYRLAVNHLADRTPDEIAVLRGYRPSSSLERQKMRANSPNNAEAAQPTALPDQFDWRLYGAVSPVKDQAVCGSCWSFGTTGTLEGAYFLKNKRLVRFSQQQLIDCSWGQGNNGCDGGEDFRAYDWIKNNGGLAAEEDYPYLGQNGWCHLNVTRVLKLAGFTDVPPSNVNAFKTALTTNGPLSVGIDAAHLSFAFYSSGVYYEPTCGNRLQDLDHSVLAVGYGTLDGQDYWLVKNSWSTWWGNDGYVLMSQKDNNCGVMTQPTYVTLA